MSGGDVTHPRELLSAYLDDELGVDERAAVDRHLALCDPCRTQLRSLKALAAAVAGEEVPGVPPGLARRIGARIDEAGKVVPARRSYFVPASIAATIGAVGLLLAIQWRERAPVPVPAAPSTAQEEKEAAPPPPELQKFETPLPEPVPHAAPAEPTATVESSQERKADAAPEFAPAPAAPAPPPPERREMARARDEAAAVQEQDAAAAPTVGALTAKSAASSACGERWVDTGVVGAWTGADAGRADRELADLARRLGGRVERVDPDEDQRALVVPRARVPELLEALARLGVSGLDAPIAPEEGFDCVRQRVTVR